MNDIVVLLNNIEINNVKNVGHGKIIFSKSKKFNDKITAIYGQNGSGKTVLVDCLRILKQLLVGEKLQSDLYNYINVDSISADIKYTFLIKNNEKELIVHYDIGIIKKKNTFFINYENISYINFAKNNRKNTLIKFVCDDDVKIKPINMLNRVKSHSKKALVNLYVNTELAKENNISYIFNDRNMNLFFEVYKIEDEISDNLEILNALNLFGKMNLFIIQSSEIGVINLNFYMPLSFRIEKVKDVISGNLVTLFKESVLDKNKISLLKDIIYQINMVINTIIPELNINIVEYGSSLNKEGKEQVIIELVSQRMGKSIPLKYESDGIKKIVSMLSTLIAVYNNQSTCLVIDEIDSGIFEYLLGELLGVLQENIKGQLIITSHNLRILEKIRIENIVFTTSNEKNRYIKLNKNKNNLRDYYLKTISLGGESEELYRETSSYEIAYALRKAGRAIDGK